VSAASGAVAAAEPAPATPAAADPRQMVILLGPQGRVPTLAATLEAAGVRGRVATITAGWQEREDETLRLSEHLGGRSDNLELYRRGDEVFAEDPELASLHRERQGRLRALQSLYTLRLDHAARAVLDLFERSDPADLVEDARRAAIDAVTRLDRRHLENIRAIHEEFEERLGLADRPVVKRHRRELAEIVGRAEAVAIAGGHVAVLLNRMRLFAVPDLLGGRPVAGWAAGAMVLGERIVVYHDTPPQGPGNAELLEVGLGLCRGVVALPHARARLRLDDPDRVSRFALRWTPDLCVALDDGARLQVGPGGWSATPEARVLCSDGRVAELAA